MRVRHIFVMPNCVSHIITLKHSSAWNNLKVQGTQTKKRTRANQIITLSIWIPKIRDPNSFWKLSVFWLCDKLSLRNNYESELLCDLYLFSVWLLMSQKYEKKHEDDGQKPYVAADKHCIGCWCYDFHACMVFLFSAALFSFPLWCASCFGAFTFTGCVWAIKYLRTSECTHIFMKV